VIMGIETERSDGERIVVTDPAAPSRMVGEYLPTPPEGVVAAVEAAREAFPAWAARPPQERADLLRGVAARLEASVDELARLVVAEEGKTLGEARSEVRRAAAIFRYYAGEALQPVGDVLPAAGGLVLTRRRPRGVIGVVTAFNYPLLVPAWKMAPALALGNTVVWKPARGATLAALRLVGILAEAGFPSGVVHVLPGPGASLVPVLAAQDALAGLTFTGSTAVGRALERLVAGRGVPLQLEMGGKNAAVVLADADLGHAARRIAYGALSGTGQKCTAIERLIVVEEVADELVDLLRAEFSTWTVGPGDDPATRMGPVASARAMGRILAAIERARDDGARVVTGGRSALAAGTGGYFVDPTLLDGVDPGWEIAREEVFGPVLAVLRVADADAAATVHDATRYGLNAGVFTGDLDLALGLGERLHAGMVHLNDVSGFPHHAPFGGIKDSGFGPLELGKAAAAFFTEERVIHVHAGPQAGGRRGAAGEGPR